MKGIINRRGSKAATRALKRLGCSPRVAHSKKSVKTSQTQHNCQPCGNAGWNTIDKVADCNCYENQEFYTPEKPRENELE